MKTRREPTGGELAGAIAADLLIPISFFFATVGCESQFKKWKKLGLPIRRFNDRPCVLPSELRAFQLKYAEPAVENKPDERVPFGT